MDDYLSREKLAALCGTEQGAAQKRWLDRYRWPYAVGIDGRPRVSQAYHDARMSGGVTGKVAKREPNWTKAA